MTVFGAVTGAALERYADAAQREPAPPMPAGTPASDSQSGLTDEARQVIDAAAKAAPATARAWPGYRMLDIPFLATLTDGSAILIGAAKPPPGFHAVLYNGWTVYVSPKGPEIGAYQREFNFNGGKVTAVSGAESAEELTGLRDYPALTWEENMVLTAAHEHFHDFQEHRGFKAADHFVETPHPESVALAALENEALARYLDGSEDALRDFAALRLRRRASFPETKSEEWYEIIEGTAKYVEMSAYAAVEGQDAAARFLKADLSTARSLKQKHFRGYAVGAVLCMAAEARGPVEQGPGWRALVAGGKSPATVIVDALGLSPAEAAGRVGRILSTDAYRQALQAATSEVQADSAYRLDAARRFKSQPGILVGVALNDHCINTGDSIVQDDGSELFDPDFRLTCFTAKDHMLLEHVMLRIKDGLAAFVLPPEATLEIDGKPWAPVAVAGLQAFKTLRMEWSIAAPEGGTYKREIEFGSGQLRSDGSVVLIRADRR